MTLPESGTDKAIVKRMLFSKFGFTKRKGEEQPAVYIIVDKLSGLIYVGSSGDVGHRLRDHRTDLRRGVSDSAGLQRLFNETGEGNLECSIVFCMDREDAYEIEQELINYHHAKGELVNASLNSRVNKRNETVKHPELQW